MDRPCPSTPRCGRACGRSNESPDAEGIDADIQRGGTIALTRNAAQRVRALAEVEEARSWGLGPEKLSWLDPDEARERLNATRVNGATYTPDCAAIQPAKLARGLADAVERKGAKIFESTRVTALRPGVAETAAGVVRADHIIRATEGYTPELAGHRHAVVPVYSMIIATEPLTDDVWSRDRPGRTRDIQ